MTYICLKVDEERYRKRKFFEILDASHNSDKFERKKRRGLTETVKELIEDVISEYECKPKRIHIKLSNSKYFKYVDVMPELEQIQTYIRYRRKQIGDNNDLDQLASYVETLAYTKGFTED
jgi:hypothetical protein